VLDAETGAEHWRRSFHRPTSICGVSRDVIVAYEMRSDGPWTAIFGIYGIDAKSGELLWTNHARRPWRWFVRCLDFVPGFTNEFRDAPLAVDGDYVSTRNGRVLDVRTGRDCPDCSKAPSKVERTRREEVFYDKRAIQVGADTLRVIGSKDQFEILRTDLNGRVVWRFDGRDRALHVDGNYYSYRLHGETIFIVLGNAPNSVPIDPAKPLIHKRNAASYQLGMLHVATGEFESFPLADGRRLNDCRIEAVKGTRLLVSFDGVELVEYEFSP
jgi:hypothetical protein